MTTPAGGGTTPARVSVCIPTHNRRAALSRILEMVRAQTYADHEIIVCDDGSSDSTFAYLSSLGWPNLRVLRNDPGLNYPSTMCRLFTEARGDFIAVQHDHDPVEPTWLEAMVRLMDEFPTAGLGCCACRSMDGEENVTEEPELGLDRMFHGARIIPGRRLVEVLAEEMHTPLAATGSLFRRAVVEQAGGYRPDWFLASDEDLYRRVAAISDVAFCPDRLFTLAARPAGSSKNLGGWRALYTLSEFRRDTAAHVLEAGGARKLWLGFRLGSRKQFALWREAVSRWLWDDPEGLREALRPDVIPRLPSGRPPLSGPERTALSCIILVLQATRPLGSILGRWWHGGAHAHGA